MLKDIIETIISEAKDSFQMSSAWLFKKAVEADYNLAKQYQGREIFELLQNIDDQYDDTTGNECVASIRLIDGWVEIGNYGHPFTYDTLQRLCDGSASSKDEKYIGCKGIGFRSVLNWADEIRIYSGSGDDQITVGFSREEAKRHFEEIKNQESVNRQIVELKKRDVPPLYPIFKAPYLLSPIEKEFDTVICLKIKPDVSIDTVIKQIKDFNVRTLLFLQHIKEVRVDLGEERYTLRKEEYNGNVVSLFDSRIDDKEGVMYLCGSKNVPYVTKSNITGQPIESQIKLGVGIPFMTTGEKYTLYTFFPIQEVKSPFPALLHATFCLSSNRDHLDPYEKQKNKHVFRHLLEFYADFVTDSHRIQGLNKLHLLKPQNSGNNSFESIINDSDDKDEKGNNVETVSWWYRRYCASKAILPTLNGIWRCPEEEPQLLLSAPKEFAGESFEDVVSFDNLRGIFEFVKKLICVNKPYGWSYSLNQDKLATAINKESASWDTLTRARIFYWWIKNGFNESLPALIYDNQRQFFTSKKEPMFLTANLTNEYSVPSFAKISVISQTDEIALLQVFKADIDELKKAHPDWDEKRLLANIVPGDLMNLREQSSREGIISPVNDSVTNFEEACVFVKWLFGIWQRKRFEGSIKDLVFRLPSSNGDVMPAKQLYLSSDYGNEIGMRIMSAVDGMYALARVDFGEAVDMHILEYFFTDLGVAKFPKIVDWEIKALYPYQDDKLEWRYIKDLLLPNKSHLYEATYYSTRLHSIRGIRQILESASFTDILNWIFSDQQLSMQLLGASTEPQGAYVQYKPRVPGRQRTEPYYSHWELPSFLRYVFGSTAWVTVGDKKVSPSSLLICGEVFLTAAFPNFITESVIKDWARKTGLPKDRLRRFIVDLGARESYLQLSSAEFYSLLLVLPDLEEKEKSKKVSREIYRDIIENNRHDGRHLKGFYLQSPAKDEFFSIGMVLARDTKGNSDYHRLSDVFFSSSAVLHPQGKYIIDIPARSGRKEDFERILNVKSYEQVYQINSVVAAGCNTEFQADFSNFLPYLMAYRRADRDKVQGLKVTLASDICLEIDYRTHMYSEHFGLLRKGAREWCIFVGNEAYYSSIDKVMLADALRQMFNVLFDAPARDFLEKVVSLFISGKSGREYFVKRDFGSLEEYEYCTKELVEDDKAFAVRDANLRRLSEIFIQQSRYYRNLVYMWYYDRRDEWTRIREAWDSFRMDLCDKSAIEDADFDAEKVVGDLMAACLKQFGVPNDTAINPSLDYARQYSENHKRLTQIDGFGAFIDEFINNPENDALMFFPAWDTIESRFLSLMHTAKAEESASTDISPDALRQLVENTVVSDTLAPGHIQVGIGAPRHKTVSVRKKHHRDVRIQHQGDWAEYLVVQSLVKQKVKEIVDFLGAAYNISWVSGASKRVKRDDSYGYDIMDAGDGDYGCDIILTSADAKRKMYIEVKSSSGSECVFEMSVGEYQHALRAEGKDDELYRIIFVSGIDVSKSSCHPKITYLTKPLTDRTAYDIVSNNYIVAGKGFNK